MLYFTVLFCRYYYLARTAARQASPCITNSRSLLKLMSIESVMPSNHLIFCCPLILLISIFPSIRVFSKELVLHIRWSKYWSFSFSNSLSNEYSGLISFRMELVGPPFCPRDSQESSPTSCPALCDSVDRSPQGSSVHGIL